MSFLGDVFSFEQFNLKGMFDQVKDKPERLLYGSADPFSTKLWNGITGSDDDPIVNEWGGATDKRYEEAEAAGIDTGAGRAMHDVAQSVASMYAGNYGSNALGGMFSSGPNGASTPIGSSGPSTRGGYRTGVDGTKMLPQKGVMTRGAAASNTKDQWGGILDIAMNTLAAGRDKKDEGRMGAPGATGGQNFSPAQGVADQRLAGQTGKYLMELLGG